MIIPCVFLNDFFIFVRIAWAKFTTSAIGTEIKMRDLQLMRIDVEWIHSIPNCKKEEERWEVRRRHREIWECLTYNGIVGVGLWEWFEGLLFIKSFDDVDIWLIGQMGVYTHRSKIHVLLSLPVLGGFILNFLIWQHNAFFITQA